MSQGTLMACPDDLERHKLPDGEGHVERIGVSPVACSVNTADRMQPDAGEESVSRRNDCDLPCLFAY
jgi:hypothetical protein